MLQEQFQLRSRFSHLGCPISPSLKIHRIAWRLVSLCRREGRAMWRANVSPRS
jgi:hypothetical protein